MPQDFTVKAGYDYRFGTVGFQTAGRFSFNLRDLLLQLKVDPNDLAAVLSEEYAWTEGEQDINPARIRLISETDCKGKTILDLGGYDGWAAKQTLDQGAARAIVVDSEQWRHYGWPEVRHEGVEYVKGDLTTWTEPADVVIAYNLLYHTHHPWRMLESLRAITKPDGVMLLCNLVRYHKGAWIYIYEPRECNPADETVYFGPSMQALERLFKHTGWDAERYALSHDRVLFRCRPTPGWVDPHPEPWGQI